MRKREPEELEKTSTEWVGQLPHQWKSVKLKFLLKKNESGIWGEDPAPDKKNSVVLRSTEQLIDGNWNIENPAKRSLNPEDQKRYELKEGDLVITSSSGSEKHIGKTSYISSEMSSENYCFSNFMQRLRTEETKLESRFLLWSLNSKACRDQMFSTGTTTTGLMNLNATILGNLVITKPPIPEQKAIATFLDRKTQAIDQLIEKKQQLIEKLKEKRQALITQAVTKGLNPDAPMKDSGIEWLGEIPEHWEFKPIKHCTNINSKSLTDNTDDDEKINYIDIGSVNKFGEITNIESYNFSEAPSRARRIIREGDTIISTVRTYLEAVAHFETIEKENLICSTGFAVLSPKTNYHDKYVYYWISSKYFISRVVSESVGVSYPAINSSELGDLLIPDINYEEQEKIVSYLELHGAKYLQLIDGIERQIEKLKEYRQSLISAAVTGKIDVREEIEVDEIQA